MPLVWLLHAENSTAFGHVIFGSADRPLPGLPAEPRTSPSPQPPADERARRQITRAETIPPDPGLS